MNVEKRSQKIVESAIREIVLTKGSYSKPSEVRALLRDPNYMITKLGRVCKKTDYKEEHEDEPELF